MLKNISELLDDLTRRERRGHNYSERILQLLKIELGCNNLAIRTQLWMLFRLPLSLGCRILFYDPKPKESSMKVMLIEPILNRYVAQTERRPERLAAERGRSVATETAGGDLGLLQWSMPEAQREQLALQERRR